MQFLTPLAFLGGLLAIPIILLYMLRLRRREVMISSTFLWQQLLQDREANTPWQRLRRNLLLILQLIILTLLVFALARPFITVPSVGAMQTALLLDASASMNATDINDGTSRFDAAKQAALDVVETMSANSIMTVIRVGATPEILMPYTADREQLRAAIANAQPENGHGDWVTALMLASEGGRDVEDFSIVVVGDGGLDVADNLPSITLPGDVRYIPVGVSDENVAITALASRAIPGKSPQLFAQLTNYGNQDADVVFSLRVDDDPVPLITERYVVPANSSLPIVSTAALSRSFSILQADVTLSVNATAKDHLTLDNTAWAVASDSSERRVLLVTSGNLFLEQVLRSVPGVAFFRTDGDRPLPTQPYDLYIFDNYLPATLPDGDLLLMNPPRSTPLFTLGAEQEDVRNLALLTGDPRLAFVDFSNVNVLKFNQIQHTGWADALVTADGLPLVLAGETDGRQVVVFSFDLRNSDLPLQITFPVLIANLLEWFTPGNVLASSGTLNIGDPVLIRPPLDAETVRVTAPDGSSELLPIDRETLIFTQTAQPGIYTVEVSAGAAIIRTQHFAINLFNPNESDIRPREILIGGEAVSTDVQEELGQRELWSWVALLALLVLLIEWYAYHRQMRIPTVLSGITARRTAATSRR